MTEKKNKSGDEPSKKKRPGSARKDAKAPKDPEKAFQKAFQKALKEWAQETIDIVVTVAVKEIREKEANLLSRIVTLQSYYRAYKVQKQLGNALMEVRMRRRARSAKIYQQIRHDNAIKKISYGLTGYIRVWKRQRASHLRAQAVSIIAAHWKGFCVRQNIFVQQQMQNIRLRRSYAAVYIQSCYRGNRTRNNYQAVIRERMGEVNFWKAYDLQSSKQSASMVPRSVMIAPTMVRVVAENEAGLEAIMAKTPSMDMSKADVIM
eukprot:5128984-Pyramimonas_sp.AAC.1